MMMPERQALGKTGKRRDVVLVMSSDAVAAALIGALVETLGYIVRFYRTPEDPTFTLGRERPNVAMLDAEDRMMISDAVLGHAAMRGIAVVLFGSRDALQNVRDVVLAHNLHTLIAPPSLDDVRQVLGRVFATHD